MLRRLEAHPSEDEILPFGIDEAAFELEDVFGEHPSPEAERMTELAHVASFVVGADAVLKLQPEASNSRSLKAYAARRIQEADIADTAKSVLFDLNRHGIPS